LRQTTGYHNLMGILDGHLIYAFRPCLPAGARVERISVTLPYFPMQKPPGTPPDFQGPPAPQAVPVEAGVLEVYHVARGRWETLSGATHFTLGEEYVGPAGEVRLRLHGARPDSGRAYYFLPPAVAYEGVVR
ncbi:MAG: hypothetical protein H5U00_10395, partial [Clostridia bacterium]|nr:hypothetical protein [Clostridia bacterium]